jgi:ATP-binding cassette subfamily F protein 3
MIKDTEDFIERFRYKATKAVQVQSRIKQLEKVERIEVDEEDLSKLNLKFPPAPRSGDLVCETKELSKSYGEHLVLNELDFVIERGEKIAFVGKNGEGKSTMVKVLMGELEYSGICKIGHNVKIGYFAQNQAQLLDENKTVLDTIDDVAVGDVRTKIRDILGAFMFRGEDVDKKVKVLSGGERSRLAMIRLLLEPVNLLVLDEPTNHLDMKSKDVLKEALAKFDGTVIVVSHDREFLDGLATKVFEFTNKKIKEHLGGIYDFLRTKKMESLQELEVKSATVQQKNTETPSENKLNYLERKELSKKITKIERCVTQSEENIAKYEEQIAEMEELLSNPEKMQDQSLFTQYEKAKKDLEQEMLVWEEYHEQLEELLAERGE